MAHHYPTHNLRGRLPGGFTLIEVLVVVVILGIASAIIVPQIGNRSDLKARAAARIVVADLLYVQNRAISTQKWHYVLFNGQSYEVKDRASALAALADVPHPLTKASTFVVTFGSGGSKDYREFALGAPNFGGQTTLAFDELGTPHAYNGTTSTPLTTAGSVKVGSGTYWLKISAEPYTGEITVTETTAP